MLDETYVEKLTGLNARLRDNMVRYYLKLNETSRIDVHRRQSEIYTSWRNNERASGYLSEKKAETAYASFLVALWAMKKEETRITGSPEEADRQLEVRIERMLKSRQKKTPELKNKIDKKFFTEITRLKEKGLSWRKISQFLKKYHGFNVSHVHLQNCFEEITQERALRKIALNSGKIEGE